MSNFEHLPVLGLQARDIMKIWWRRLTHLLTHLINDEAVYRTAPATPGLLISMSINLSVFFSSLGPRAYGTDNCALLNIHMNGNSQGVKRPYLGHKMILFNTLL